MIGSVDLVHSVNRKSNRSSSMIKLKSVLSDLLGSNKLKMGSDVELKDIVKFPGNIAFLQHP